MGCRSEGISNWDAYRKIRLTGPGFGTARGKAGRDNFVCAKEPNWDAELLLAIFPHRFQSARMTKLKINGEQVTVSASPDTPLLWVLRDEIGLTGTKFGCGIAACGACTVIMDGTAIRSCITPINSIGSSEIVTIEGLSPDGAHPLQIAWRDLNVAQCGYCQPGQIMNAAALLKSTPNPADADIDSGMSGNICRCGTYPRIRAAIKQAAAAKMQAGKGASL
jgi:isoquinoline 1-oxidoreductase alpha subunit